MIRDTARLKNLNSPDPLRTPLEARVRRRPLRHAVSFAAPRGQTLQHQLGRQLGQLARASVLAPLKSEACQRSQDFHWIVAVEPGTLGKGSRTCLRLLSSVAAPSGQAGAAGVIVASIQTQFWVFESDSAFLTHGSLT